MVTRPVKVDVGRTTVLQVHFPYDLSADAITSEIRAARSPSSRLIATWAVSFKTDGSDGWLILTLDDSDSTSITDRIGYMDLKRVTAGEPVSMLDEPLQVEFRKVVTA